MTTLIAHSSRESNTIFYPTCVRLLLWYESHIKAQKKRPYEHFTHAFALLSSDNNQWILCHTNLILHRSTPYPTTLINVGNFVSIKLTKSNFLLRKTQKMGPVECQDLNGFLDETTPVPNQALTITNANGEKSKDTNPDCLAWKKSDRLLCGWDYRWWSTWLASWPR